MRDFIVQRVVFPTNLSLAPLYFGWNDPGRQGAISTPFDRRSVTLRPKTTFDTNTFFNSFFECYWRKYTHLDRLVLRVRVSGRGVLELRRRSVENGDIPLRTLSFDGTEQVVELEGPPPTVHLRQCGSLYFTIWAESETTLHQADWIARDVEPRPVKMLAGYCSYNREADVLRNLNVLASDPVVADSLHRIVVVDQGSKKIRAHSGYATILPTIRAKLALIEQDNFGGAGGFTRVIMEALHSQDVTHVLLMDDDADVEPESVFRTINFLALAREDLVVGGAMLDLLRPNELFEAGGIVDPRAVNFVPPFSGLRVDVPANLAPFLEIRHVHYNAWWFFAFPLALVDRVGLPLPVFIHLDDVEYGYRMTRAGIPAVPVPGLAVWHQPFYLKQGGWISYYEQRNWFLVAALFFPPTGLKLASLFLGRLIYRLLRLEYFEAWMLCEAAADYCRGPSLISRHPAETHDRLLAAQKQFACPTLPKSLCLPQVRQTNGTKSPRRLLGRFTLGLFLHLFRRSPSPKSLPDHAVVEARWVTYPAADVLVVDNPYADSYTVRRRSWARFVGFLARGIKTAIRLIFHQKSVVAKWQAAHNTLSSEAFWQNYLSEDGQAVHDQTPDNPSQRNDQKNRHIGNDRRAA